LNSYARSGNVNVGAGWFPRQGWLSFSYALDKRRYGIPAEADAIDLEYLQMRRHSFAVKGGWRNAAALIEGGDVALSYNDYVNREFEFESDENATELDSLATNKNFNFRSNFVHRRRGKLSGTFGFSGFTRDYRSVGEEAPAPHTKQHSFAAYILEKLDLERIGFQFGGRVEQNGYDPEGDFRKRNFVGFSGSVGTRLRLWNGGAFVADYRNSFRAPALEELYNHGPHPGILVFDIGNENLKAEHSDGLDLSLRHNTKRLRLEGSTYYYKFRNFVFPAFTGLTDTESNLPIVIYSQGPSRYLGAEASIEAQALPTVWLTGKFDYTRAELTKTGQPLPRMTPARGTVGVDWRYKALNIRPELLLVGSQHRVGDHETPTAGYVLVNIAASYAFVTSRAAHVISVSGYNLGDRLYRNHLSYIKEIAPEIGRQVRLSYTVRF
jgi:iron complex outermembrane receptor protein